MTRFRTTAFLIAAALLLLPVLPTASSAGGDPGVPRLEHFKTYKVGDPITLGVPVFLRDQFGPSQAIVLYLEQFANPVDKNGEGLIDDVTHLSWWAISEDPMPERTVLVSNQFGPEQIWRVRQAKHLLAPALKNNTAGGPIPDHINHFKCYDVLGQPIGLPVVLRDQFGTRTAIVEEPACLCNPAEKITATGQVYPILDPETHLACYRIQPPQFYGITVFIADQFFIGPTLLTEDCLLCVPSQKTEPTPAEPSTWGRVKAQYR